MKSCLKYLVLLFSLDFIEGSRSFRCDYKYSSKAQAWFKAFTVPATWSDARLRCALEGAVLASPTTPEIQAEMKNIIDTSDPQYEIFTGIHATFSPGDYYTVEGKPLSHIPLTWSSGEPDNRNNNERCIILNGHGDAADRSCEETRPYICYRTESYHDESYHDDINDCGTTDPEYNLDKRSNKCYKFHTTPRNFSRAFLACAAEGGHLAIINSELESAVLRDLYAKYPAEKMRGNFPKDYAYIGFLDWGESWDWRTIHGETIKEAGFDTFYSTEPNIGGPGEPCGVVFRAGLLGDFVCNTPTPFICEKSPGFSHDCHEKSDDEHHHNYHNYDK